MAFRPKFAKSLAHRNPMQRDRRTRTFQYLGIATGCGAAYTAWDKSQALKDIKQEDISIPVLKTMKVASKDTDAPGLNKLRCLLLSNLGFWAVSLIYLHRGGPINRRLPTMYFMIMTTPVLFTLESYLWGSSNLRRDMFQLAVEINSKDFDEAFDCSESRVFKAARERKKRQIARGNDQFMDFVEPFESIDTKTVLSSEEKEKSHAILRKLRKKNEVRWKVMLWTSCAGLYLVLFVP